MFVPPAIRTGTKVTDGVGCAVDPEVKIICSELISFKAERLFKF